ncbi:MAG TPA: hypothetical protein VFW73_04200 [Lacipirellulaceae bacterium]|nr:hypothetical protein [Lacipirellulaceae bacterium]
MNGMKIWRVVLLAACIAIMAGSNAAAQFPGAAPQTKSKPQAEKPTKDRSLLTQKDTDKKNESKSETASADFCHCLGENSAAVNRIERALRAPLNSTGLEFAATPLIDVVHQLSTDYGIPIRLDKPALEEAAIGTDTPVDASIHNVSLRSGLQLIVKSIQLTYDVQDETLRITTKEAAEKNLTICVYDARKILPDANEKNIKTLTDTIQDCVATDTWSKNGGGQADIRAISPGLLVITQTRAVHEQIRNLLATIQRMTHDHSPASAH